MAPVAAAPGGFGSVSSISIQGLRNFLLSYPGDSLGPLPKQRGVCASHARADGDLSGFWVSATCACSCLSPVWAPSAVPQGWKPLRLQPGSVIGVLPTSGWCLGAIGNFLACHQIPWSLPLTTFGMITPQGFPMSQAGMKEDASISQAGPAMHPSLAANDSLGNHFSLTFCNHKPMASPHLLWQRGYHHPVRQCNMCKSAAAPITAGIYWVFPSSSSKDQLVLIAREGDANFWHSSLRKRAWCGVCSGLGIAWGPAASRTWGIAGARCRARFTPGSFLFIHPETVWGGCKTHMTCAGNCRNTLLAGASHSDLSQAPCTTGPASSWGRQDAGLPTAPCPHHCLPGAWAAGSQAPACTASSFKHLLRGRGTAEEGGTALGYISTSLAPLPLYL